MKVTVLAVFAAMVLFGLDANAQTVRHPMESHIYVENKSDAFAWITAYTPAGCFLSRATVDLRTCQLEHIAKAWCVSPGAFVKTGIANAIYQVRAEVTIRGCSPAVKLDRTLGFPMNPGVNVMTYYVHGSNGKYTFNNTP